MVKGLLERLNAKQPVLVAEGYLFEFERLGYLQAGGFVPEVVLEHPDRVKLLHEDFVHAGSDVVQAFTFYTNPAKMAVQGRKPHEYEEINRKALRIAKEVAVKTGTLMCGDLSATNQYSPKPEDIETVRKVFKEQVQWAVQEGADFIVGETFWSYGEAELCLEAIKQHGNGLPAVITITNGKWEGPDPSQDLLIDGVRRDQACKRLLDKGADVVGLNCFAGMKVTSHCMKAVRAACGPTAHLAALPVPYRTTMEHPAFFNLKSLETGKRAFFDDLDCWLSAQSEVNTFAEEMKALNVNYVGLCCGNNPRLTRRLAECYGRKPPASRYTSDMSKHIFLGNDTTVKENAFVRKTLREAMDVATDDIKNLNEHKSTCK